MRLASNPAVLPNAAGGANPGDLIVHSRRANAPTSLRVTTQSHAEAAILPLEPLRRTGSSGQIEGLRSKRSVRADVLDGSRMRERRGSFQAIQAFQNLLPALVRQPQPPPFSSSPRDANGSGTPRSKKRPSPSELLAECQVALQREQLRRQACEAELESLRFERGMAAPSDLCGAAAAGKVETLRLLARGDTRIAGNKAADVSQGDYDKRTPLHLAASEGQEAAVRCLLEELGAAPSPRDRWGNTPLDDAIRHGHEKVTALLESHGGCKGMGTGMVGPQHLCKAAAAGNVERLRLLASTADVCAGDYDKRTPLHLAASEGQTAAVRCLLEELGAAPSPEDRWGNTPLNDAIRHGHEKVAALLESHGCVKGLGTGVVSAQHLCKAAAAGDLEQLRLLASTADVCAEDYDKRTPLHLAASEGQTAAVRCLLEELGAAPSPEDRWGNTPLDDAARHGHEKVVALLESHGGVKGLGTGVVSAQHLCLAASSGDTERLRSLARTTDVNLGDYDKRTALHLAAAEGLLEVVQTLIELGARVSPMDRFGLTPLDEARRNAHGPVISLLESRGGYSGASRRTAAAPASAAAKQQPAEKAIPSVALSTQREQAQDLHDLGVLNLGLEFGVESTGATSLPPALVGTYSCAGSELSRDLKKVGKTNQDCACVATPLTGDSTMAAFCVFDGHGRHGHHVSQEALHSLHFELERAPRLGEQTAAALPAVFETVQAHLRLLAAQPTIEVDARSSGACAIVAILHGHSLTVAGVGDCRAVLATTSVAGRTTAVDLSVDHKVDTPEEQARIEAAGAAVRPGKGTTDADEYEPPRVYHQLDRPWLGPGLQMSRVLGDLDAEECGIIATPDVVERKVDDDDRFLILASDGVWEFIDSAEAVQIVDQCYSAGQAAHEACRMLIVKAAVRWAQKEGPIRDDITAVVIYLSATTEALASRSG